MKPAVAILLLFLCGCAAMSGDGRRHTASPAENRQAAGRPCNEAKVRAELQEAHRELDLLAARLQAAEAEAHDLRKALAEARAQKESMAEENGKLAARLNRLKLTLERLERLEREMEQKRRKLK